jgi:hypothetical protein
MTNARLLYQVNKMLITMVKIKQIHLRHSVILQNINVFTSKDYRML